MNSHTLDNPVWSALTSGNNNLALGNEAVKYFPGEVSSFAAIAAFDPANFQRLYDIIPFKTPIAIFTINKALIPDPWKIAGRIDCVQMLLHETIKPVKKDASIKTLDELHIPDMLALTKLTNPGPFLQRTIDFGHYEGIFDERKLVAMAGQRLHSGHFAEISAVCTHPDYTGRGYASQLILHQAQRIQSLEETPFLHVKDDNVRAIKIYEALGFSIRCPIVVYLLKK
ncbi:FR47-like protein [Chitinophaga costaii]|uniref:FR47-like protein n=1 Tax=Chitinophaga costaii TaxID=1335309 RepID=A0A1C4FYL1_9BACT|nr:GNAT family N-acetyltransferase [Chitinophaga costaii]PUZ20921.1 GNAT family N-acetyltransferase [Chitinophaga costaii]SCC60972.1 FR47-like protein [Chitinophaga costaii]